MPRAVFGLCLLGALTAVVALGLQGPPGSGYGWGAVVVSMVLVSVPLFFVGLAALSGERRYAMPAVVVAALVAVLAVAALVGNWSGGTTRDHVLEAVVAAALLTASLPAIRWESRLLAGPRARPRPSPRPPDRDRPRA